MSEKLPPPKGRAALIQKLLARAKEAKPGAEPEASRAEEEAPKPRGRALLIQKLAEMRATRKVGAEGPSTVAGVVEGAASSPSRSVPKVEEVTQKMEEASLAEPCSYKGIFCGSQIRFKWEGVDFFLIRNR